MRFSLHKFNIAGVITFVLILTVMVILNEPHAQQTAQSDDIGETSSDFEMIEDNIRAVEDAINKTIPKFEEIVNQNSDKQAEELDIANRQLLEILENIKKLNNSVDKFAIETQGKEKFER